MENQKKGSITKDEIIKYVDILVKKHKSTYDKRLIPLLYEFFLRSSIKFNWDRKTFLTKYNNFSENTKIIKFAPLEAGTWGVATKDKILINNAILKQLKKGSKYDKLIVIFNHECLHHIDYEGETRKKWRYEEQEIIIMDGLYKIENGSYKNSDMHAILDEVANTCAEYIISSNEPMNKTMPIYLNTSGYSMCKYAFSIMCATLDISEIEMAYLKGRGRKYFDEYLKHKYPELDTNIIVECFEISLNAIFNKSQQNEKDEPDINKAYEALLNVSNKVIYERTCNAFTQENDVEETVERLIFDIYKIKELIKLVNRKGNITIDVLLNQLAIYEKQMHEIKLYRKFAYCKKQYPIEIMDKIMLDIEAGKINGELIERNFLDYEEKNYRIQEIIDKYYAVPTEPLNDNTNLIEKLEKEFMKSSIKDKNEEKGKISRQSTPEVSFIQSMKVEGIEKLEKSLQQNEEIDLEEEK